MHINNFSSWRKIRIRTAILYMRLFIKSPMGDFWNTKCGMIEYKDTPAILF